MLIRSLFYSIFIMTVATLLSSPAMGNLKCTHSTDITDPRFGVMATVGTEISFSDIGCAVVWRSLQCTMDQMAFDYNSSAHDYNTGKDIPMSKAFYSMGCGLQTPMGFDIAAFEHREDAEAFASGKPGCKVLTFQELLDAGLK